MSQKANRKRRNRWLKRITGNLLSAFLSPLVGSSIAFNIDLPDDNARILVIALISSLIITGLVVSNEMKSHEAKEAKK